MTARALCAAFLGGLLFLTSWRSAGQAEAAPPVSNEPLLQPATIHVHGVVPSVRLDARLGEACWAEADSAVDFRQREPANGAPASERTVIRVVRDDRALYVAIRAWDREMGRARAAQLRRDADLGGDDHVTLLIDSFRDRRTAFVFATNPRGAMWDAQVSGTDGAEENWNGVWQVATATDSAGWTAEFRIPFQTLRFPRRSDVAFGFNVQRFLSRRNEEDLWQSFGRAQGLYQLQNAGTLVGLGSFHRGHGLELFPYGLARAEQAEHDIEGAVIASGATSARAGLDAKLAVTPTLTADCTVRTDFAQVEDDQEVINLTRFPLYFPEKREFFLESNSLYGFGSESAATLFYSRRIGHFGDGAVPILGGTRLYGRLGPWSLGMLGARTGGAENASDVVLRFKRDVFERSTVGIIGTMQSRPDSGGVEQAHGVDCDFPLVFRGQNLEPFLWAAYSHDQGSAARPVAWRLGIDYPNDLLDNFVSIGRVQSGFLPPLGFVHRTGAVLSTGHFDYMPRPHLWGIRQLDFEAPIPSWSVYADEHGSLAHPEDWRSGQFEWRPLGGTLQSGDWFEANVQRWLEAPGDSFEIFTGVTIPPGRYWWTRGELQYATSSRRPWNASTVVSSGGFYGGRSVAATLKGTWRAGGHIAVTAEADESRVTLPQGRFTALTSLLRVEYAIGTGADFLALVQYDNEQERADLNLRFHWSPVIGDDLFLVWNSGYSTSPAARDAFPGAAAWSRPLDGGIVLKFVHRIPV